MGDENAEDFRFVPPTEATIALERQRNDDVRRLNLASGDNGSTPRSVDHFAYPKHPQADFGALSKRMEALGFGSRTTDDGSGLIFSRTTPIAGEKFDRLTATINVMMEDFGWQYDGWETPIVKEEDSQ